MDLLHTVSGQVLLGVFIAINLTAFLVMGRDKHKAIRGHNAERAPEGFMFFLSTMLGSVGIYLWMLVFRHKTRKWYFQLGIPALVVQNLAALYVVFLFLQ